MKSLIIFVKYPEPGKVKTRLAASIGNDRAVEIYRSLVSHTLKQAAPLAAEGVRIRIFFDPPDRQSDVRTWLEERGPDLTPQSGTDLGERMHNAFETVFSENSRRAVIIGTDCPDLTTDHLRNAFSSLDTRDLVLGPAADGGYYLLGMNRLHPSLFTGIDWSTPRVYGQTLARIARLCLSITVLSVLSDVDRVEDFLPSP